MLHIQYLFILSWNVQKGPDDHSLDKLAEDGSDDLSDDPTQIIELNFALGDFNDSALALAEEELLATEVENNDESHDSDGEN